MSKLPLLIIIFFGLKTFSQPVTKIRIDPSKAYGGNVSEYFINIEYIPLETTKVSLFGDIWEIAVTDSSYVISDLDTKAIYFFALDGKFIRKVNNQTAFFYDQTRNQIVIYKFSPDGVKMKFLFLNLRGQSCQTDNEVDLRDTTWLLQTFAKSLGADYFLSLNKDISTNEKIIPGRIYYAYTVYKDHSLYKQILPIDSSILLETKKLAQYIRLPSNVNNGTFYASTPFDFKLYKINKDTAIQMYQLIFPAGRALSKKIIESDNGAFLDSMNESITRSYSLITNVEKLFFGKSKLFFKLITPASVIAFNNSINEYQYNFCYDTLSGKLVCLDRIIPDSISSFLPVMGETSKMRGLLMYHDLFYSYISSLSLFSAKEATAGKHPNYPPILQNYFKTQTRKSNPVIVRMKLKE